MPPPSPYSPLTRFLLRYPLFILIALAIAGAALWNWTRPEALVQTTVGGGEGKSSAPTSAPWDDASAPLSERFSAALAAGKVDAAKKLVEHRTIGSPATRAGWLPRLMRAATNGDVYTMTAAFNDPRFDNIDIAVALRSFPTDPRYIETKPRSKKPAYE